MRGKGVYVCRGRGMRASWGGGSMCVVFAAS
jgi:hypothetical protein